MLTVAAIDWFELSALLSRYGLALEPVPAQAPIPGSYWGEPEAGVIANRVYARADTPVHSVLHEASHLLVAPKARRDAIHTDASDSIEEENAACYLQILLADALDGVGAERLMQDMDAWGYTFRLGSTQVWFERDADEVRAWLAQRALLPALVGAASAAKCAPSDLAAEAAPTTPTACATPTLAVACRPGAPIHQFYGVSP